jgi:hypothetical protein
MHPWCSFCFCAMFVIKGCKCLIVSFPHTSMVSFCFCAMFVITGSECLIVRILHASMVLMLLLCHVCDHRKWVLDCQNFTCIHGAHSASVPCLWSQYVSAWYSEFHMHAWCSFCFCAMFVIKGSECLIIRIPHASKVLILLLCHVCDHSMWVLDCQNSACMHGAHSSAVPCLWSQKVSGWLSEFHMHPWGSFCFCAMCVITVCECLIFRIPHACMVLILLLCHVWDQSKWVLIVRIPHASKVFILLLCHVCDHSMWVLDCQNSACIHGAHSSAVPCLWSQKVSGWLSEFHIHPWCSFCFCTMFVTAESESLIVGILHSSMVLILLLCCVCDHSMWVLDFQSSTCIHGAHSASVPCLWSKQVSAWLSEFHMHPWCSFWFYAMFVITGCECFRIPHASMVLILLLCHICDHRKWVLDCQNFICIHVAHSASVPCLWSKDVSGWLSEFHMHPRCSFYFCAMFVIKACECLLSEFHMHPQCSFCFCAMFVIKACECLLSEFHMHPQCSFCFCAIFVIKASEWLIVRIPHASKVLILLLWHVCNCRKWVLDC